MARSRVSRLEAEAKSVKDERERMEGLERREKTIQKIDQIKKESRGKSKPESKSKSNSRSEIDEDRRVYFSILLASYFIWSAALDRQL